MNLFYSINSFLKHNIYMFHIYHRKEGDCIFCFGVNIVPTIWLILFFDPPKVIVWVILTIIYIIFHFILKSLSSKPTLRWHCNHCQSSCKWQWKITFCFVFCISTLINYSVILFISTSFILSIVWSDIIYTCFVTIIAKRVS